MTVYSILPDIFDIDENMPMHYRFLQLYKLINIIKTFTQNIDCGYTLKPPDSSGSNVYPSMLCA